jgi:hypothetical protein
VLSSQHEHLSRRLVPPACQAQNPPPFGVLELVKHRLQDTVRLRCEFVIMVLIGDGSDEGLRVTNGVNLLSYLAKDINR